MSSTTSPRSRIKAEAEKIAQVLKATSRGEKPIGDRGGKIAASLAAGVVTFGIVQNNQIVKITMDWDTIRETGEVALCEYIVRYMMERPDTSH